MFAQLAVAVLCLAVTVPVALAHFTLALLAVAPGVAVALLLNALALVLQAITLTLQALALVPAVIGIGGLRGIGGVDDAAARGVAGVGRIAWVAGIAGVAGAHVRVASGGTAQAVTRAARPRPASRRSMRRGRRSRCWCGCAVGALERGMVWGPGKGVFPVWISSYDV